MAENLVLFTGTTGFIGFATLRATLRHGYRVRAAVRSEQKAKTVRSNSVLNGTKSDQLEFVVVPDFLVDRAFDEAVRGVEFIIHVASPIASPEWSVEKDDLDALMVDTVQRIVVTRSSAGLVPYTALAGGQTDQRFGPEHCCEPIPPPYMNITQVAYTTSKILALKHAEEFVKSENPSFDVIHIHPVVVLGRDELALITKALDSGSNAYALGPVLGRREEQAFPASVTHVNDVALAHVRAFGSNVPGNQSFLLSSTGDEGWTLNTTKEYVQKHFPEAVREVLFPNDGSTFSALIKTDPSKTEKVLGIKPKLFEDMTVDLVGRYIELSKKEAGQ